MVLRQKRLTFLFTAASLLAATFILSVGIGATTISPLETLAILAKKVNLELVTPFTDQQEAILLSIRTPRVFLGILVGVALAVSGASLQGLFKNPLADPGIIGVSSGAMVGIVSLLFFSATIMASSWFANNVDYILPVFGFLGGAVSTMLVYRLATTGKFTDMTTLLLAGIALGTLSSAIVGIFIFLSDDAQLRSITFWMLGSISGATWKSVYLVGPIILISTGLLVLLGKRLNALAMGDNVAFHIGINVETTKRLIILLSCLATGAAVCVSGMVGFVGLVAPHLVRLSIGADHRYLVPAAALLGGLLLIFSDLLARTLVAPTEVPLGVVTSLIGAPFFIWLVYRNRVRVGNA